MRTRLISIALAALVGFAGLASAQVERPGEGVTLEPAIAGWDDARPVQAVFDQILEELGYTVDALIDGAYAVWGLRFRTAVYHRRDVPDKTLASQMTHNPPPPLVQHEWAVFVQTYIAGDTAGVRYRP